MIPVQLNEISEADFLTQTVVCRGNLVFATAPNTSIDVASMPIIVLYATAELDCVSSLEFPIKGPSWKFDVKQAAGTEERLGVIMDPEEEVELEQKGTANFVIKFPGDKKQSHVTFLDPSDKDLQKKKVKIRPLTAEDFTDVPILAMECRGIDFTKWHPTGPYSVTSSSGTVFDDVKLDEGDDWCEYDEKSGESMTVGHEIKYEFRAA